MPKESSRMQITGKNALVAAGIAFGLVLLLTAAFSIMAYIAGLTGDEFTLSQFLESTLGIFKFVGICVGSIVFIRRFALLQRIRNVYPFVGQGRNSRKRPGSGSSLVC